MKVLLKIDGLSGKVYAYKEHWEIDKDANFKEKEKYLKEIKRYDVTEETESLAVFTEAEQTNQDIYYEDGKLVARPKDPNEYHNAAQELTAGLARLKNAERSAFIAFAESGRMPEAAARLEAAIQAREEQERALSALKEERIRRLREKKLAELAHIEPAYDCSICLIIRDESEYLEEWLNWHIGQGVQHFYIYDHGSKEPVAEFIQSLDSFIADKVTVTDWSGLHINAQHEAYNDCLKRFGQESKWIGFIDSDEMVRVKDGAILPEFLKEYEDYAGVFMLWVVYDANGHVDKSGLPCRERFTRVSSLDFWRGIGKVFVQPGLIRYMMIHNGIPAEGFQMVDEAKKPFAEIEILKKDATDHRVCVDHYYTKSHEEWVEKLLRGACDPNYSRKYEEFFQYNPDLAAHRQSVIPTQEYEVSKKYLNFGDMKRAKLEEQKSINFKYYCSICLIIRDENEYLEEWLNRHIYQGAEHFYIYDHGSKKPVAEFVRLLEPEIAGMVTVVDWSGPRGNAQPEAYNDCLERFGTESRWIGFIDADEHTRVKTGQPLPEFLKDYEDYAGIFAVWVIYGANGQKEKSNLPLRQRFPKPTQVKTWSDKMGKVFVQPALMKDMYIHNGHPADGFSVVGEAKDAVPENQFWKENAATDLICIDHYFTKSYEEWLEKLRRGTGHSQYRREYKDFFEYNPDMVYCREETFPIQEYDVSTKDANST